jgi:hypothetical protein
MGSSKSSEKLGKSLSKIKHGVLGKSIEGIVDNSVMDSAFDLADMYVSKTKKICFLMYSGVSLTGIPDNETPTLVIRYLDKFYPELSRYSEYYTHSG